MKNFRLAIFDLDGTLLDTIEDICNACNYALVSCGCPERKLEEYNSLVGRGIYNLFRGALPEDKRSDDMVMKMHGSFVPYYNEHKSDFTKPYPGIKGLIEELRSEGISLAVASNKYQEGTEALVDKYFGRDSFIRILGQREGQPIKPDPQIVGEIMSSFIDKYGDISKEEIVYIGDSNVDMETGLNAGVTTIGVSWGFRTKEELAAYGPYMICDDAGMLKDALLRG